MKKHTNHQELRIMKLRSLFSYFLDLAPEIKKKYCGNIQ